MTDEQRVALQVAAAQNRDVGKGMARISRSTFDTLGLRQRQIIEIFGKRGTPAVSLPPYEEDEGLEIALLDGLQRANAQVSIGDSVEIRPADVKPAARGTFAPAQKNIQLSGSGEALKQTFLSRPVTERHCADYPRYSDRASASVRGTRGAAAGGCYIR